MKTLSLTQPWATLVAIGAKRIETRSWSTKYRGPLAIHAAKRLPTSRRPFGEEPFRSILEPICGMNAYGAPELSELPRGAIVATCELVDVAAIGIGYPSPWLPDSKRAEQEQAFGDFTPGRYAWVLRNVRALPEPIPAKGALGLWEADLGVLV